jgi:protein-S-isoprenylcysteine O-methyltransferase Ste14
MLMVVRHVVAIAALPFTVAVLIPLWIVKRTQSPIALAPAGGGFAVETAGFVVLAAGLFLFVYSLRYFAVKGRGTLAPWDPPKHLVVEGPYRYVRNPMISGVIFVLFGEALILRSWPHAQWALTFFALNAIYIPLLEEPMLRDRFGDSYREYCRHVRRLLPRFTPWSGSAR